MNRYKESIVAFVQRLKLGHLLFWALSILSMTYIYRLNPKPMQIDYIYALLLHIPIFPLVYVNMLWCIPKYLAGKKPLRYLVAVGVLVALGGCFHMILFDKLLEIFLSDYFFVNDFLYWDYCIVLSIYIVISTAVNITVQWYRSLELIQQRQYFELEALKQQMNPHFFFNTLNSLYGLSLTNSAKTPEAILQLSNIMRYMIYDSNKPSVLLTEELSLISDYVAINELRNASAEPMIRLDIPTINEEIRIAPNLIMPLLENAIKHRTDEHFITFKMEIHPSEVVVLVINSADPSKIKGASGIGLKNLSRRLELLYNQSDLIIIDQNEDTFAVKLKIPTNLKVYA